MAHGSAHTLEPRREAPVDHQHAITRYGRAGSPRVAARPRHPSWSSGGVVGCGWTRYPMRSSAAKLTKAQGGDMAQLLHGTAVTFGVGAGLGGLRGGGWGHTSVVTPRLPPSQLKVTVHYEYEVSRPVPLHTHKTPPHDTASAQGVVSQPSREGSAARRDRKRYTEGSLWVVGTRGCTASVIL